jgi:hypothetical protein
MTCKRCTSGNQREFSSEINVHFPGLKNLDKPSVLVFPKLLVCIDCGLTEFDIQETDLRLLGKDDSARGARTFTTPEGSFNLSAVVVREPFDSGGIETRECAADKSLALKNGFYRH